MKLILASMVWKEYLYWVKIDKAILKRMKTLIK